jgi:hypothetical protein
MPHPALARSQTPSRSNADVHEGELDADVPSKRVRSGHAAVELADYSHPAFATADIELLLDRDLLVLS